MNSKVKVEYPVGVQWTIVETRLQEIRNLIDGYLQSTVFNIPEIDVQYRVVICPNGNCEENRGQSMIFLHLEFEEQKEIKAEFSISIESANYSHESEGVYKKSFEGWGGRVCTTDELFDPENRFFVDGEMVITIEGSVILEKEIAVKLCKLGNNGNTLGMDLWNQDNKDFVIIADGKEIHVHKWVLSSRSPVFAAMFQPHTQEAQENKVVISDFPFCIVETAIKLCYDSRLVENIPLKNQMLILLFFDKYDIQSLKVELENLMISEVDESNVCRLANCSLLSNSYKLQKKCDELLQQCFRKNKLVNDFDILDTEFAVKLLKKSLLKTSL